MPGIPMIVPVSNLRQDAASVLKNIRSSGEPLIITQRGRATAVILSLESYKQSEHERQLLLLLARGEKEISKGDGYSLKSVLSEADALLNRETMA